MWSHHSVHSIHIVLSCNQICWSLIKANKGSFNQQCSKFTYLLHVLGLFTLVCRVKEHLTCFTYIILFSENNTTSMGIYSHMTLTDDRPEPSMLAWSAPTINTRGMTNSTWNPFWHRKLCMARTNWPCNATWTTYTWQFLRDNSTAPNQLNVISMRINWCTRTKRTYRKGLAMR